MTDRNTLFRKFGPVLLEAVIELVMDEINILRSDIGLGSRTKQQLIDALKTKHDTLPLYDWMQEE
jgi:hypothetical protein